MKVARRWSPPTSGVKTRPGKKSRGKPHTAGWAHPHGANRQVAASNHTLKAVMIPMKAKGTLMAR